VLNGGIGSNSLSSAVNLMEATALFDGVEQDIHVRVAEHEGNIYLDLCNPQWQVVEITPSGWEEEIEASFDAARPKILGALLDAVSGALRDLPTTQLSSLPRMADFALWVTAAEKTLGWDAGTFMAAYQSNRTSANELALESSPVGSPLLELLKEQGVWNGSSSELLDALDQRVTDQTKRLKSWPKNGRSMVGHLKRLTPNLRAVGWEEGAL
jgi:putative DNA primase/helicase